MTLASEADPQLYDSRAADVVVTRSSRSHGDMTSRLDGIDAKRLVTTRTTPSGQGAVPELLVDANVCPAPMSTIDLLARFPVILRDVVAAASEFTLRKRASDGKFALVEHAWHLADLEEEGYRIRIERLLTEDRPYLLDFAGDLAAANRRYIEQAVTPALQRFAWHRQMNRERLGGLQPHDWTRRGSQEGVGELTLARLPEMMLEHDIGHANDLVLLLPELEIAVPVELTRFAAGPRTRPAV